MKQKKHRKNCECCPVSQLIVRSQRLSWIQVLNCQNCSKCLKCNKSLGLLLGGVLKMSLSLSLYLYLSLSIFFGHVMFSHHSEQMSQRSQVSRMALKRGSQNVFVFVIVIVFVFVFVNFFWSCYVFSSLWTNVSKVTSL